MGEKTLFLATSDLLSKSDGASVEDGSETLEWTQLGFFFSSFFLFFSLLKHYFSCYCNFSDECIYKKTSIMQLKLSLKQHKVASRRQQ